MQYLQQGEVLVGIYIAAYDRWPGQIWLEPEGEGVAFPEYCYHFVAGP